MHDQVLLLFFERRERLLLLVFWSAFGMCAGLFAGEESGFFAHGIDEVDAETDAEQSQGIIPGEKSFVQEDA